MRYPVVGLAVLSLFLSGCHSRSAAPGIALHPVTPAAADAHPVAPAPPPPPHVPQKEMVIAWQISLLYLLEDGKLVGKPIILNSAEPEYFRPAHLGDFTITERIEEWRSNLYDVHGHPLPDRGMAETDGAIMKNWMRLGNLGVGLHYSPAFHFFQHPSERHRSHGCYRMSKADSRFVFRWTPTGTPIHVVRSLAGTQWAFLLAQTPPELLPGYHSPSDDGEPHRHRRHRRHHHDS